MMSSHSAVQSLTAAVVVSFLPNLMLFPCVCANGSQYVYTMLYDACTTSLSRSRLSQSILVQVYMQIKCKCMANTLPVRDQYMANTLSSDLLQSLQSNPKCKWFMLVWKSSDDFVVVYVGTNCLNLWLNDDVQPNQPCPQDRPKLVCVLEMTQVQAEMCLTTYDHEACIAVHICK